MITNILFFIVISSGSIFAASFYRRKYEEVLPITVFGIVLIQYVFALFGKLRLGAYVVFLSAAILIIYSVFKVIIEKTYKKFTTYLFTPGFLVFIILYLIINLSNVGKLVSAWDEFSHWADVVKVMSTINDLATNPASESVYKSYVPAMSLFQYNLQVLNQIIKQDALIFCEWRLYLCYQIATYVLLFPILNKINWKDFYKAFLIGIVIFLMPAMFDGFERILHFYNVIYIDFYLGILAGYSMFLVLDMDTMDRFALLNFLFSLTMLVLTKDAGFPLAFFLAIMCIFKHVSYYKGWKIRLPYVLVAFMTVLLPKLSWDYHLLVNSVEKNFGTAIDIRIFFNSIFSRNLEDYRFVTFYSFLQKLTKAEVVLGDTNISISYILILVVLIVIIYILLHKNILIKNVWSSIAIACIVLGTVLYLAGMVVMYMFRFYEYEATSLASFTRYISIYIYMLSTASWLLYLKIILQNGTLNIKKIFIGLMLLCMISTGSASQFLSGNYKLNSEYRRKPYIQTSDMIHELIGDIPRKVYIVSQADNGFDYWVLKYSIRPHKTNSVFSWSIGKPFYKGDVWTKKMGSEEWQKELKNNYDYVLVYKTNDYFIETYATVFENPNTIMDRMLYIIDKNTGKLHLAGF